MWFIGLSITLQLRRASQESIKLERKSYLDCSLDKHCTRVEFGKGDILVADIEELETMGYFPKTKWKIHFFQLQMDEFKLFWRRSGLEKHPPRYGIVQF